MGVLELIVIVFAVLQIVLFFKLWGMTNDVGEIVRKMRFPYNRSRSSYPENYHKFLFLLYNSGKDEARDHLMKVLWGTYSMNRMLECSSVREFEEYRHYLESEYKGWFDKLGEEFPSFDEIRRGKE